MSTPTPITVAHGDGIGPEIMDATLRILEAAGARLDIETIEIGEKVYREGHAGGIRPESWDSLRRTRVFLKAPITTPQGGGVKSLNVTIRKSLGLYANVRPCVAYHPFVKTRFPTMDLVIVRENEEDLYAGIEHRQTDEVFQCLKLISRPGCERIVRYAFEYARLNKRRKVTCFTKDNIMKITDGLFHRVFDDIGAEYPDLEKEHWIVDIGAAKVADSPEDFDVIVMPNLYGDIISDIAAQVSGSVGLGGSSNIGEHCAMFEAIHGSAPDIAGKGIANPSGLLLGAVMMLVHIGQGDIATRVHNAWMRTLEDGVHTGDIFVDGQSRERAGTTAFADAVIARLGQKPEGLTPVEYAVGTASAPPVASEQRMPPAPRQRKELVGVDLFLDWRGSSPKVLGDTLRAIDGDGLALDFISNRGVKVYPTGMPETFCTDHWRCRFLATDDTVTHAQVVALLQRAATAGFDFVKTEHLCRFDGQNGFSAGHG
ncbi:MAG: NADP-dependent isocitrate dehydrogenase [Deltaproteobacteria bacterium]|nr:MAG: NADP-dependent isocitrate dehydrogenase [Deltaproteobacteria bacterium]